MTEINHVDPIKQLSSKAKNFLAYCFKNPNREFDNKPFRVLTVTSIVRIVPFMLTEKTRIDLDIPDEFLSGQNYEELIEIRKVAEFAGLDTRYIENLYSKYLKSLIKG